MMVDELCARFFTEVQEARTGQFTYEESIGRVTKLALTFIAMTSTMFFSMGVIATFSYPFNVVGIIAGGVSHLFFAMLSYDVAVAAIRTPHHRADSYLASWKHYCRQIPQHLDDTLLPKGFYEKVAPFISRSAQQTSEWISSWGRV